GGGGPGPDPPGHRVPRRRAAVSPRLVMVPHLDRVLLPPRLAGRCDPWAPLAAEPGAHRSRAPSTPPGAPYRSDLLRGGGWVAARGDHRRGDRRFPPGSAARPAAGPGSTAHVRR